MCITRQEIKEWLYTFQPAELNFERFYRQQGRFLRLDEIYDDVEILSAPLKKTGIYVHSDFKCLHPDYQNRRESQRFQEDDMFYPFLDMSLHRHPRFFPEYRHKHEFFEICYTISGECTHTILGKPREEKITLGTGDLVVLPPGMEHSVRMDTDSVAVNILMRKSTFKEAFLQNIPSENMLYEYFAKTLYAEKSQTCLLFHTGEDEELLEIFYDLAYEYCNEFPLSGRIMNLKMGIFFAKILRNYYSKLMLIGEPEERYGKIPSILQYMEVEYAHVNVQDVADYFHLSTSYLSKIFKEITGNTLISELQRIRISNAQELLFKTKIPVERIAVMVGYEDQTHFIRLFKKQTGYTPAQYRKQMKKTEEQ